MQSTGSHTTVSPYLHPLDEFYTMAGMDLPSVQLIDGEKVLEPQKSLLVHQSDMTPTLENFYKEKIHIQLLDRHERGDFYYRRVLLVTEETEKVVEFGAIKINLQLFTPAAQRLIKGERMPLGHVLANEGIKHTSRPKGFLKVRSDKYIETALRLDRPHILYGRRNTLWDPNGKSLAEIVEILPP